MQWTCGPPVWIFGKEAAHEKPQSPAAICPSLTPTAERRVRTRRTARKATSERRATCTTLCPNGRALRQNASLRRLQPLSGAAAVQRGEKRIQGGSRGNSQSPYPSLAAGGCHAAANAAISGARTPPQKPQSSARTQSNTLTPCPCGRALRKNAPRSASNYLHPQHHRNINSLRCADLRPRYLA